MMIIRFVIQVAIGVVLFWNVSSGAESQCEFFLNILAEDSIQELTTRSELLDFSNSFLGSDYNQDRTVSVYFTGRRVKQTSLKFLLGNYQHPPQDPLDASGYNYLRDRSLELGEKIKSKISSPRTILYPASGYDAATGFLVFSTATKIIGIDNHAFWDRGFESGEVLSHFQKSSRSISRNRLIAGWELYEDVDKIGSMADAIVFNLQHKIENFRLRNIYELRDSSDDWMNIGDELSHGVVVFDTGDGTPLRYYIHIQTAIISNETSEASAWLLDKVKAVGFESIFYKAAMNFQTTDVGFDLSKYLKDNGGVILDTDDRLITSEHQKMLKLMKDEKVEYINHPFFGYSPRAQLLIFKGK